MTNQLYLRALSDCLDEAKHVWQSDGHETVLILGLDFCKRVDDHQLVGGTMLRSHAGVFGQ